MSRHEREAKLEALHGGGPDGMVLITERGGRKRDARKTLQSRMAKVSKMMATTPNPASDVHQPSDAPMMGSYQKGTLGEVAKRMATESGLEYAEGRAPGSMFFKGKGGEKMALQHGDEFLDLLTIGGGKSGGKPLYEMWNKLADEGGTQGRFGINNLSNDAIRSIENAVAKGHLVRNPAGAGWLSTAQKMGKKAAAAAKGAVGGVTALLDPLFGAMQDPSLAGELDPEMRQTLESVLGTFGGGGKGPIG
jgi:hypothetical protein